MNLRIAQLFGVFKSMSIKKRRLETTKRVKSLKERKSSTFVSINKKFLNQNTRLFEIVDEAGIGNVNTPLH